MLAPMPPIISENREEPGDKSPLRARVLAMVLVLIAQLVVVCGWAWAVFVFQPFGHRQWTMTAIAVAVVCLMAGLRRGRRLAAAPPHRNRMLLRRSLSLAGWVSATALACWFGLIV